MQVFSVIALSLGLLSPQDTPRTQVLILGTYHMHNPGADLVKAALDDHLSPKRQAEIEHVVTLLAEFKPTKIAVEHPYGSGAVNERYAKYLAGEYALTANETDQIGLRLAKRLGHTQLYPFDYKLGMDFDKVFSFAQANKETEFLGEFQKIMAEVQRIMDGLPKHTVLENLLTMNDASLLRRGNSAYLLMARLGKGEEYPGAEVVAGWYERNIKMYANLMRFTKPGDRVLVIVGSGHASILRQLIEDSDDLELVDAATYLKRKEVGANMEVNGDTRHVRTA